MKNLPHAETSLYNSAVAEYILQNCQTKSRRDIDRYLSTNGYNRAEIKATWNSLLRRQVILPAQPGRLSKTNLLRLVIFVAVAIVIIGVLIGPRSAPTVYADPDKVLQEVKVGQKATVVFRTGRTMLTCENKTDATECFWRANLNTNSGVLVRFPKSKGLAPNSAGLYNEIRILDKQGDRMIAEIEREYNLQT